MQWHGSPPSSRAASSGPAAVTTSIVPPRSRAVARSPMTLSATSDNNPLRRSSMTSSRRALTGARSAGCAGAPSAGAIASPGSYPGRATGRYSENTLPCPGVLRTVMAPPSRYAISRQIDSPSPVPPYLRLVVPSACWNAPKITSSCCPGMPTPVSTTRSAMAGPWGRTDAGSSPGAAGSMRSSTLPVSVNLTAFDSRFRSTCRSRESSVSSSAGTPGARVTRKSRPFWPVMGRNVAST
ncbi:hypothetical protein GCM10020001_088160 [Nonomuraea salmonea]